MICCSIEVLCLRLASAGPWQPDAIAARPRALNASLVACSLFAALDAGNDLAHGSAEHADNGPAAEHAEHKNRAEDDRDIRRQVPLEEPERHVVLVLVGEHADDPGEGQQEEEIEESHRVALHRGFGITVSLNGKLAKDMPPPGRARRC